MAKQDNAVETEVNFTGKLVDCETEKLEIYSFDNLLKKRKER